MIETTIYVGLNDADTKKQKFETERYLTVLKRVCAEYRVPFSFHLVQGGYLHDDGEYTEENTIELSFIEVPQETIDLIAEDLCTFFHQESVFVTTEHIKAYTIRDKVRDSISSDELVEAISDEASEEFPEYRFLVTSVPLMAG